MTISFNNPPAGSISANHRGSFKRRALALAAPLLLAACNSGNAATNPNAVEDSGALSATVLAAEETWNEGVLFTDEEIASLEGHTAHKIVFGLEPGKCTGDIVSVSEW